MKEKSKPGLSGLSLEDLQDALAPLPAYRGQQVFQWLAQGVPSFQAMTNLPIALRKSLEEGFSLYSSSISAKQEDSDGTVKLQITLEDQERIESVLLIDREGRQTACLSTQAGCPMSCVFCKTGTRGFSRNLTAGEIVEQFFHLRSLKGPISNIVVMGMGEPLLNLAELRKALRILTDPEGTGLSKRRITLSTSGIDYGIRELADFGPDCRLALSLTTGDKELREKLMPVTKTNPLPALKEALLYYQRKQRRRVTLEAVLIRGINTREKDVHTLADFAQGLETMVNLIPWNPIAGLVFEGKPLQEPTKEEFERFAGELEKKGLKVTRRLRRGKRIAGACGQLGAAE
ncbi:MAG: 23S rRNA (adenine(2503)-C(2))-methyltransferase RlmN [Treponema sp.]|nr:23S rRNA (adenine(2503)-C(2))-methyltransferase RlmN [Treponema sp.]